MENLPKHIVISGFDMNEIEDSDVSEMIQDNFDKWSKLNENSKKNIAQWWADNYEQLTIDYLNDDDMLSNAANGPRELITDSELIQYLTEEGYNIK